MFLMMGALQSCVDSKDFNAKDRVPELVMPEGGQLYFEIGEEASYIFQNNGGLPNECWIPVSSSLPAGLAIKVTDDGLSCEIYGYPIDKAVEFPTIISTNNYSRWIESELNLTININSEAPYFKKLPKLIRMFRNMDIPTIHLNNGSDATITKCAIDNMPSWMIILKSEDSQSCIITGHPTQLQYEETFQIHASSSTGDRSIDFTFEVVDQFPTQITVDTTISSNPSVEIRAQPFNDVQPDHYYNFHIDWGDGSTDSNLNKSITHHYLEHRVYNISISGYFPSLAFSPKLIAVDCWGNQQWKSMAGMFQSNTNLANGFNSSDQPDVSFVTSLSDMFKFSNFNDDISQWDVSSVQSMDRMMGYPSSNQKFSTTNYDALLQSWSQLNLQRDVTFDAGASTYSESLQSARDILTNNFGWHINDGGMVP
ncbi:BspA family leucine-rich repeat surface protein [Marinicellulosiphila megalodicopiae]|uniref:BspA family leucine-rich repeat surface protein n=1 Tax=Marinicellulosiphila megalodicopiae TaxID=2724896 RepID=UPI003BB0EF59